jgi:hypothetical protein
VSNAFRQEEELPQKSAKNAKKNPQITQITPILEATMKPRHRYLLLKLVIDRNDSYFLDFAFSAIFCG